MKRKYSIKQAYQALGRIDKAHESKRITKRQHDVRSMAVLRRLVRKK